MGGRRPTSIASILGPNRDSRMERQLQKALQKENPEQIATVSSNLAQKAATQEEVNNYFAPFLPFIKNQLERAGPLDSAERRQEVRAEWSRIKRELKLEVRTPVNDAVVQAVMEFLRDRGK